MAASPKIYQRLTRDKSGLGTYSSLWLAADHLMLVRSSGYHEDYTQLHFGDLKGIFLTETNRRRSWGIFWGVVALLAAAALMVGLSTRVTVATVMAGIFLGLAGVGLLWNHLLGPGCRAYVVTGVQMAELPPLVRLKKARAVVARVAPLVAAAQAHLAVPLVLAPPPSAPSVSEPPPVA